MGKEFRRIFFGYYSVNPTFATPEKINIKLFSFEVKFYAFFLLQRKLYLFFKRTPILQHA